MKKKYQVRIKLFNRYSWSLVLIFICAVLAMQYHTAHASFEGFFLTFPLVAIAVYWSEKSAYLIALPENQLKKRALFKRDIFIISFSFLEGCFISLILAYHNPDARGWWVFIVYFMALYGLIFSVIFSAIAALIKNHKTYIIIFSGLIMALIACGAFLLRYIHMPYIGPIDMFYFMTCTLLLIHLLFSITHQCIRRICSSTDKA
jgi:hypothetical protein